MRWLISSHKAALRFLRTNRRHYHLNRGFFALHDQSLNTQPDHQLSRYTTRTSPILNDTHISTIHRVDRTTNENNNTMLDLEIISRETIKPSSPTPQHLRTYNLSIIDQFMVDCDNPVTIFLPNNDKATMTHVLTKRSKHLKQTLSEILTRFYPFAGEIKDTLHVECNDSGVDYVEARVNQTLHDFLRHPTHEKLKQLTAETEPSSTNHVTSFQINIFDCGGIALCTNFTHKVIDAYSYFVFIKAWAADVRGSPEKLTPSYVGSELFPNNPSLKYSMPATLSTRKELVTKRFVFSPSTLDSLKAAVTPRTPSLSRGPSRTEASGTLIWKAASKAASTVRAFDPQSPHFLFSPVNLRTKSLPPLPNEAIGNLATLAFGTCFPKTEPDLPTLMSEMRGSIAQLNADFIEARKGKKGHEIWAEGLEMMSKIIDNIDRGDSITITSLLNNKVREIDFGWGKPIWFYYVDPGMSRMATLNDTIKVGGVEAVVTLSPQEMKVFESDPDVLSYTTVDPSPLMYVS